MPEPAFGMRRDQCHRYGIKLNCASISMLIPGGIILHHKRNIVYTMSAVKTIVTIVFELLQIVEMLYRMILKLSGCAKADSKSGCTSSVDDAYV